MQHTTKPLAPTVIPGEEAESYTIVSGRTDAGLIVLCDHADNALPPEYGSLGLGPDQFKRHIAYDIGAAALTRAVAAAFNAPALMTHYSRLLIDPNRGADDPTLIMRLSDGAVVPGNRHVDEAEREKRTRLYYTPYHQAIDRVIDACLEAGTAPALLSIHSFTESWKGVPRPWHVGILWSHDSRLARPLIEGFSADPALIVGDNEPYHGSLEGDCLWQHGTQRGLANAIIEVRQDLIRDAEGQANWANRLIRIVESLHGRPDLHINVGSGAAPVRAAQLGDQHMSAKIDPSTETELQAAAYRKLVEHLRERADVQNIDLMNLAGFCRNCLANWYQTAASERGHTLTKDEAREIVYGMPYKDWQAKHQKEATPEQQAKFATSKPHQH